MASGVESDEIEKWLNAEFETPAEDALNKATADMRLSPTDWRNLIRFAAAQDARTPARLAENIEQNEKILPGLLHDVLRKSVRRLEHAKRSGQAITPPKSPNSDYIPLRITTEIEPGQEFGTVKGEIVVGRGLWLFSMRQALTNTVNALLQHRWSILRPADGLTWFTSDDPVVRLNYYENERYDFKGGWGSRGTEIFLPLDPHHLLYTQIGERPSRRGSSMGHFETQMIRRFIAEHAHRFIFAPLADAEVPRLHPRVVSPTLVRDEHEQWQKWHHDQMTAERELMGH